MSRSRLTTIYLAGFLVGILIGTPRLQFPSPLIWVSHIICGFLGLFRCKLRSFFLIVSAVTLGVSYVQFRRASAYTVFPSELHFSGRIVRAPDVRSDKSFLTIRPRDTVGRSLRNQVQFGNLLVKTDRYPAFHYGDVVEVTGRIELPEAFNGFSYPLFLERDHIYGVMTKPRLSLLHHQEGLSVFGALNTLRGSTEELIQRFIPEPESSFLGGILLGSKRAIPTDIQEALRATGTSHIVAISGANITILLTLLLTILPLYTRRSQFLATLGIGSFISLLTGASASVVRGAVIAALGRYARMHGRQAYPTSLLLAGMASMLLVNPLLLVADPGFQLSFAAFAGLLYLGKPMTAFTDRWLLTRALPDQVRSAFAETAAATLGTAPLSFLIFGQLSLLSLIVNPLILWLLPAATSLGLAFVALGWIPTLGSLLSLPLTLLLRSILNTIQWFASLGFGTIQWKI